MKFAKTLSSFVLSLIIALLLFVDIKQITNPVYAQTPIEIYYLQDLDDVRNNLTSDYVLMRDLDFNDDSSYDKTDVDWESKKTAWTTGQGWEPIGEFEIEINLETMTPEVVSLEMFEGDFDGQGYSISNLYIDTSSDFGSLFLFISGNFINLGLDNIDITVVSSGIYAGVGGFALAINGNLTNCYTTGEIDFTHSVGGVSSSGGLAAASVDATLLSSLGLEGLSIILNENPTIENSYSSVNIVTPNSFAGGLIGETVSTTIISNSYATGSVSGENFVGGLVGENHATITNSYATGYVSGENNVGGLVGLNYATITNSYATGSVSGEWTIAGLVGYNQEGTITNSYSTGNVSGQSYVGGLVGYNQENTILTNSFWDTQTSGTEVSDGGTGITTSQMKFLLTFNKLWDIVDIYDFNPDNPSTWYIDDTNDYPRLAFEYLEPEILNQTATNITTSSARLNGNLTSLGLLDFAKVYFQYRVGGGEWSNTTLVEKTSPSAFTHDLTGLNPNTTYEYRSVVKFGQFNTIRYATTLSFKTLPVVIPKVILTNIGLITNVPDRDNIFFYFTSTTPRIKGIAYPNTTVKFSTNNQSFTTQADSEGKFNISLTLPRGRNVIEYYAYDPYGDQSPTRTLTLVVGTENFPQWLLIDLGLITPEPEVIQEPEQTQEPTEEEEPEENNTPESDIQVLQFLDKRGNPLVGALVKIDGLEYYTDSKGEIEVVGLSEGKSYKVKVEHNGVKYETEVLGESTTGDSIKLSITEEDILDTEWKKILIYGGISLLFIFFLILIFKKKKEVSSN